MLKNLGCVNIADSDSSLLENLSMEYILMEDPDFIFFVQLGDDTEGTRENMERFFAEHPAWASLTAVREGRVILLDKKLYNMKPNARWGEAYLALEEMLR
jgi:iron complex transport system substrate-binding protein